MRPLRFALITLCATFPAHAQWTLQDPHTTADLRGIDSLGNGIAWASGTNGTVLRTEDAGFVWQLCAIPPAAEKLDFRGIQAFDNNTAIVMSSGKGDLSRLYKTTDGCQTWKKVFDDPDDTGFFDSLHRVTAKQLFLLGDPVNGKFSLFTSRDAGNTWFIADDPGLDAPKDAGAFAASNSSLSSLGPFLFFGTGGPSGTVYRTVSSCDQKTGLCSMAWRAAATPVAHGAAPSGVFSLAGRFTTSAAGRTASLLVAVGGNYEKATDSSAVSAFSSDGGNTWTAAQTMPGGYRSAVAYDSKASTWITVGPNGTDISADDGRNWRPLKPDLKSNEAPDADQHWNALSLPFAVGPHGRIGTLRQDALTGSAPPNTK